MINQIDGLVEFVNDSKIPHESKTQIIYDLPFSLNQIRQDIYRKDFEGVKDKTDGLKHYTDLDFSKVDELLIEAFN